MVRTAYFDQLAKVDYRYQDARSALLIRQYMSKLSLDLKQGKVFIAAEVTDKMITNFAKPDSDQTLATCDAFLKHVDSHYKLDERMDDTALCGYWMKAKINLLTRVGTLIMYSHKDAIVKGLPKIEAKFVLRLMSMMPDDSQRQLPSLIYPEATQFLTEERDAQEMTKAEEQKKDGNEVKGSGSNTLAVAPLTFSAPLAFSNKK